MIIGLNKEFKNKHRYDSLLRLVDNSTPAKDKIRPNSIGKMERLKNKSIRKMVKTAFC